MLSDRASEGSINSPTEKNTLAHARAVSIIQVNDLHDTEKIQKRVLH